MRFRAVLALLTALIAFTALNWPWSSKEFLQKKTVKLGEEVSDFRLPNTDNKPVRLSDYRGKIVMIHFWSATCPYVVRYDPRIRQITSDYADQGVVVLGIASNQNETLDQIRKAAEEHSVNFPILIDQGSVIADQFGAITTPHVFIIDREGKLAYEGSVDDQGWTELKPPSKNYARDALEALLSGTPVPNPQTKTFGCTVKR